MNLLSPCKKCQNQVAQEALFCPRCGIKEPVPENKIWLQMIAVAMLVSLFIYLPNSNEWFESETPPPIWAWVAHFFYFISLTGFYFKLLKKYF